MNDVRTFKQYMKPYKDFGCYVAVENCTVYYCPMNIDNSPDLECITTVSHPERKFFEIIAKDYGLTLDELEGKAGFKTGFQEYQD